MRTAPRTLRTMSAPSACAALPSVAPAATKSASGIDDAVPAPDSTTSECLPDAASFLTVSGVAATRVSPARVSRGIPMIIQAPVCPLCRAMTPRLLPGCTVVRRVCVPPSRAALTQHAAGLPPRAILPHAPRQCTVRFASLLRVHRTRRVGRCPCASQRYLIAAAIALPTSVVVALPPKSGVRGADASASIASIARTTAAAASGWPR